METSESKKPRIKHPDRLTIENRGLERLDDWINAITLKVPGIHLTKNALVNWLILSHAKELSAAEEKDLTTQFYDEEKFLRYAVRELKQAKRSGETRTLSEILKERPTFSSSRSEVTKKSKGNQSLQQNRLTQDNRAKEEEGEEPREGVTVDRIEAT